MAHANADKYKYKYLFIEKYLLLNNLPKEPVVNFEYLKQSKDLMDGRSRLLCYVFLLYADIQM